MITFREQIKGKLVASCQAAPGDPLEDTDAIRRIARAVAAADIGGLRINSAEHIAAIRQDTALPIIGIEKHFHHGLLRITPTFAVAEKLARAGASIIALDCTCRTWKFGEPWRDIVRRIHHELHLAVMADISTFDEALDAQNAGVDFVGTTLNGYTDYTAHVHSFDWGLLARLAKELQVPIIAEGHLASPLEARRAVAAGAWSVVVGSAITRPGTIAADYVAALKDVVSGAAIGVDIGGTSIKAALVGRDGAVTLETTVPTNAAGGKDAIAAGLTEVIGWVQQRAIAQQAQICGIGIASAGSIDARTGDVFAATENLPGWTGFPLCAFVSQLSSLPAYAVNDAQAAALSELRFGVGRNLDNFVLITLGTGVGGGVIANGGLLKGACGFAGTLGHQAIRLGGRPCNCGRLGCLEAYVSSASLLREYAELTGSAVSSSVGAAGHVMRISELASAGDTHARQAYMALAGYLAEGLANLFNVLDPEAVFVSGGLVEGHPQFVADVESRVAHLLHFGCKRKPRVLLATQGYFAGVQGAAALVFDEQLSLGSNRSYSYLASSKL